MKHIITAIALLAASAMPALAQTPQLDPRTQDYRTWSAEQMVKHLVIRLGRMNAACKNAMLQAYLPKASESCEQSVMGLYPQLKTIREIAAGGDEVLWAEVMGVIHTLERDTEPHLQTLRK